PISASASTSVPAPVANDAPALALISESDGAPVAVDAQTAAVAGTIAASTLPCGPEATISQNSNSTAAELISNLADDAPEAADDWDTAGLSARLRDLLTKSTDATPSPNSAINREASDASAALRKPDSVDNNAVVSASNNANSNVQASQMHAAAAAH